MPKLEVELVPSTQWGSNMRDILTRSQWDKVRKHFYEVNNHECQLCDQTGFDQNRSHAVEAHEQWEYDDENLVQTLTGIEVLCPECHRCKHLGRALKTGAGRKALSHLVSVNGFSEAEAQAYVQSVFAVHAMRSMNHWEMNLDWMLTDDFPLPAEVVRPRIEAHRKKSAEKIIRGGGLGMTDRSE